VSAAYTVSDWAGFGTAVAAAAAALAGLLFVAISINLRQILDIKGLPSRAGQTLILLATALITAVLVVVPGQSAMALGLELLACGVVIGAAQFYLELTREPNAEETLSRRLVGRTIPTITSCGCLMIAGVTLLGGLGGGLYWLVPSVVGAMIFGLFNVWILLVEILR
jgi:hypothetical protein